MTAASALIARIDRAWARCEGWLIVALLVAMIIVGGYSAALQPIARANVAWASSLLVRLDWSEPFLRMGTFWLAFLGASLGARAQQHIAVSYLLRMAPPRAKFQLRAIAGLAGGLFSAGLAIAFWSACMLALSERSIVYGLIVRQQQVHVCDATDSALVQVLGSAQRPVFLCALRALLRALALPSESPEAALLLIAPAMLAVIALRLFGQGVRCALIVEGGEQAVARAYTDEQQTERERANAEAH